MSRKLGIRAGKRGCLLDFEIGRLELYQYLWLSKTEREISALKPGGMYREWSVMLVKRIQSPIEAAARLVADGTSIAIEKRWR